MNIIENGSFQNWIINKKITLEIATFYEFMQSNESNYERYGKHLVGTSAIFKIEN